MLAAALLLVEYLIISVGFHAHWVLQARGGEWQTFQHIGEVGHVAILALTVFLSLLPWAQARGFGFTPLSPSWQRRGLLSHALLFGVFFALSYAVFGRPAAPPGPALVWMSGWASIGLATGLSLVGALFGLPRVRLSFVALVLGSALALALVARGFGYWSQALWRPSSLATLTLLAALLRTTFEELEVEAAELEVTLRDFSITIAPECSGLEGVGLISVLLGVYLVAFRGQLSFPRAFLLLPLGALAVWLGNVLRLAVLIAIGAFVDPELAIGAFHSKAGWVMFCAIALGVATLGQRSEFFARNTGEQAVASENPTAAYLMPLLVLVATALVTGALAQSYDKLYALRILAALTALIAYRSYYREHPRVVAPLAVFVGLAVGAGWLLTAYREQASAVTLGMAGAGGVWLALRALGSSLVVPLAEELAFRGFLLRWLISRDFTSVALKAWTPLAVLGSSLAFGVLHGRWLAGTIAGLIYALLQIKSGRLADAVVAHCVTNGVIAAWVLATGDFRHW